MNPRANNPRRIKKTHQEFLMNWIIQALISLSHSNITIKLRSRMTSETMYLFIRAVNSFRFTCHRKSLKMKWTFCWLQIMRRNNYVLIDNFNRLMRYQTKDNDKKYFCMYCLQCFSSAEYCLQCFSSADVLNKHIRRTI